MRKVVGIAVHVRKAASVVARRGFADIPGGSDSNLTPVPPSSRPPATNSEVMRCCWNHFHETTVPQTKEKCHSMLQSSPATSDPWTPVVDPKTGGRTREHSLLVCPGLKIVGGKRPEYITVHTPQNFAL